MSQTKAEKQKNRNTVKKSGLENCSSLQKFVVSEHAATSIEYAIIASGISIVIIGGIVALKGNLVALFQSVLTALT